MENNASRCNAMHSYAEQRNENKEPRGTPRSPEDPAPRTAKDPPGSLGRRPRDRYRHWPNPEGLEEPSGTTMEAACACAWAAEWLRKGAGSGCLPRRRWRLTASLSDMEAAGRSRRALVPPGLDPPSLEPKLGTAVTPFGHCSLRNGITCVLSANVPQRSVRRIAPVGVELVELV